MCFYEQYRFQCGDWKWGNFRQHCTKEYRMGETCGMKLVYETNDQPKKCKWCEKYETKYRKRVTEAERVERWQREGKNPASIEKGLATIGQLDTEIRAILDEITKRRANVTSGRVLESYYG